MAKFRYARLASYARRHARTLLPFVTPRKALNVAVTLAERKRGTVRCKGRPFVFRVDPCSLCNLRCPSCETHTAVTDELRMMPYETFTKVIDAIRRTALRVSLYDMGEPLLNRNIYKMIRYCTDRRISTLISTNFNRFRTADVEPLFDSGLTVLEPCLDGFSQEAYATYRRKGDVEVVKQGIAAVMAEKRRRKAKYPVVGVQVITFQHVQPELPQIAAFLDEHKVDAVTYRADVLGFDPDPAPLPGVEGTTSERCYWLYMGMMVRPDGNVYPCCGRNFDRLPFGNLLEEDLDTIWNNDHYRFARSLFEEGPDLPFDEWMVDVPCFGCVEFTIRRGMVGQAEAAAAKANAVAVHVGRRRVRSVWEADGERIDAGSG